MLLALQSVSSFQLITPRSDRLYRTVRKSSKIDLSSPLNITSRNKGCFNEATIELEIQKIKNLDYFASEQKSKENAVPSEILDDLRSKTIKDLKLLCSKRSIRYRGLKEHDEFVQAIVNDIKDQKDFSRSGYLIPGTVTEISGDILEEEMTNSDLPLLLDVYATFCGPCKISETEFEVVARRLGKNCRVAKLDSQKHHDVVNSLQVQGLPATILIHKGRIVSKREGLVYRDQLMDFVDAFIPKQIC